MAGVVMLISLCAALIHLIVLVLGIIACSTTHWLNWDEPYDKSAAPTGRALNRFSSSPVYGLRTEQQNLIKDASAYCTANNIDPSTILYLETLSSHIGLWRYCQNSQVQFATTTGASINSVFPDNVQNGMSSTASSLGQGCRGYRSIDDTLGCEVRVRDGVRTTRAFVIMGIIFSGLALSATLVFSRMNQTTALLVGTLCLCFFAFACWIIAISVYPGAMNGGFCARSFSYRGTPMLAGRANRFKYGYSYWIAIVCPILEFINLLLLVALCAFPADRGQTPPVTPRNKRGSVDLDSIELHDQYVSGPPIPPISYGPPVSMLAPMGPPMAPVQQMYPVGGPVLASGPMFMPPMGPQQMGPVMYQEAPPLQLVVPGTGLVLQ
eukprot:TRINITY_DN2211_c0_g1_i1.p1 TRINITY_DN2211_c0_g1~~TRINITY_DN2211_c0_g1_i1.p1  ORF type:complete len:380 (-),score=68.75 TRINITY_DN2211_c0_g1_i1:804-1943(-)